MKAMSSQSPSRPSGSSRMSRRSPGFRNRVTSPERRRRMKPRSSSAQGLSPASSPERRDFRSSPHGTAAEFPVPGRSRSPLRDSKVRSFSPKRKLSPDRERRREPDRDRSKGSMGRKRTRSKSPASSIAARESACVVPYSYNSSQTAPRYQSNSEAYSSTPLDVEHIVRSIGERFHRSSAPAFDERPDRSTFKGAEDSGFNIKDLKNIVVGIRRFGQKDSAPIERSIINPDDVVLVRRPEASPEMEYVNKDQQRFSKRSPPLRRKVSEWEDDIVCEDNHRRSKSEGSRPIFARDEIIKASDRTIQPPVEDHHRVVAIHDPSMGRLSGERYDSPPPRYSDMRSRDSYYASDRDHPGPSRDYHPPRDYDRPHGPPGSYEAREKGHYDRFESRHGDDLRHDLKVRRTDDGRYPGRGESVRTYERGRDYGGESDSDLRMRINEKRADRHDREPGFHRMMERPDFERDRDRRRMMQPSPPGSERRRGPIEGYERNRIPSRTSPVMHSSGGHDMPPERFRQGHPPERFHTSKPWNVNPEYVPKGRAYFEHDNRDDMVRMHGRGRGMPHMRGMFRGMMRGRGMMRRPMRGMSRGFMGGRATRRGIYTPCFKPGSPHWEHDMFDKASNIDDNNAVGKR